MLSDYKKRNIRRKKQQKVRVGQFLGTKALQMDLFSSSSKLQRKFNQNNEFQTFTCSPINLRTSTVASRLALLFVSPQPIASLSPTFTCTWNSCRII